MDDQCLSEAKTDRVLAIYSSLVGGAVLNKADLAQQFHVTQRSIQRDIESLRCFFAEQELPQDIVYDKRSRGYRLIDNAQKKLSNSEVLAVCKILLESRSMVTDEMMPLLDRLPTAKVLAEDDDGWDVEAEVFGSGVEMWMRSQGDYLYKAERV